MVFGVQHEWRNKTDMFNIQEKCDKMYSGTRLCWPPLVPVSGVARGGGVFKPPPEIPKALQHCAKRNPICENC